MAVEYAWDRDLNQWVPLGTGSSTPLTVLDETTALPPQGKIAFVGGGVTATDDAANGKTVVSIPRTDPNIFDEGIQLPTRPGLNFVGAGVTAVEDAANNRTTITVPGGRTILDSGIALADRAKLNFVGTGVEATDDAAGGATNVTIPGYALVAEWCGMYRSSPQVVARDGLEHRILYSTKMGNQTSWGDIALGEFIVPADGLYHIGFRCEASSGVGVVQVTLKKNAGGPPEAWQQASRHTSSITLNLRMSMSLPIYLATNDRISVDMLNELGTDTSVFAGLTMHRQRIVAT